MSGPWEKDDKSAKATARKMLALVSDTIHGFLGQSGPIGCYTCHHNSTKPEIAPAAIP